MKPEYTVPIHAHSTSEAMALERQYGAYNYEPLPVALSKGEGVFLWDIEGTRYYDFLAAYSAVNQGHCHPRLIKVFENQAKRLTLTSRAFYNDSLGPYEKFITNYFGYQRVLPMNTGVEGVETAIKLCRRWAYDKKRLPDESAKIIVCANNFHGRTIAAISASTSPDSRNGFGPFAPGFVKIPFNNIPALESALADPCIAGFLVEPIQGEAGVIVPAEGYLRRASELCRSKGVLLIADEVQTGLARTGKLLACEHDGIRPDILILGKALSGGLMPVSAVLASDEIMLCVKPGEHGSTFGGNPLACQVAMEALKVIREEGLIENSMKMGELFRNEMNAVRTPIVADIRGRGLLNAVQILEHTSPDGTKTSAWDICLKLLKEGVLAKPTRRDTIRFTPPLIITEEQLRDALKRIRKTIQ